MYPFNKIFKNKKPVANDRKTVMSLTDDEKIDNCSLSNDDVLNEEKENDNGNVKDEEQQYVTPDMVLRLPTITESMLNILFY